MHNVTHILLWRHCDLKEIYSGLSRRNTVNFRFLIIFFSTGYARINRGIAWSF